MDATYPAYNVSKAAMNAITRVLAADLRSRGSSSTPSARAGCGPTWAARAPSRSVEEGAASVLWAARLGPDGPSGGFFRDGNPVPW